MQYDLFLVKIETSDPAAVSILPKRFHGCVHDREKKREGGDPEVAQLLKGSKGRPHLWAEWLIVVRKVPHKSEQSNHRGRRVASSLL